MRWIVGSRVQPTSRRGNRGRSTPNSNPEHIPRASNYSVRAITTELELMILRQNSLGLMLDGGEKGAGSLDQVPPSRKLLHRALKSHFLCPVDLKATMLRHPRRECPPNPPRAHASHHYCPYHDASVSVTPPPATHPPLASASCTAPISAPRCQRTRRARLPARRAAA